jgi:hypothetical protein
LSCSCRCSKSQPSVAGQDTDANKREATRRSTRNEHTHVTADSDRHEGTDAPHQRTQERTAADQPTNHGHVHALYLQQLYQGVRACPPCVTPKQWLLRSFRSSPIARCVLSCIGDPRVVLCLSLRCVGSGSRVCPVRGLPPLSRNGQDSCAMFGATPR